MPHQPYLSYTNDLQYAIGHATDAGLSGKNNEDLYAVFETQFTADSTGFANSKIIVAVVADGIGGSVAGEMASDLAIQAVAGSFRDTAKPAPLRLEEAIQRANREIYQQSISNPSLAGMGTTIVGAIIGVDQFQVGHVGDSRAYLLRDGQLHLLTLDHSWAQEAIEAGRLTLAEARVHTNRHVIKRFLGGGDNVVVDYQMVDFRRGALHPDAIQSWPRSERIDFLPGDSLLLCTDGLSDVVSEDRIKAILSRNAPQSAVDKLIAEANKAGGPDNITAVVVRKAGGSAVPAAGRRSLLAGAGLVILLALLAIGGFFLFNGGNRDATLSAAPILTEPVSLPVATASESPEMSAAIETAVEAPGEVTDAANAMPAATDLAPTMTPVPADTATPTAVAELTSTVAPTATNVPSPADPGVVAASDSLLTTTSTFVPGDTEPAVVVEVAESPVGTPANDLEAPLTAPSPTVAGRLKSTPIQATPTVTPLPPRTLTPTRLPSTPASSPVSQDATMPPTPRSPGTAWQVDVSVDLQSPDAGQTFSENDAIEFSWNASAPLSEPYTYELVFWQEAAQAGMRSGQAQDQATSRSSRTIKASVIGPGRWCWGIYLRSPAGRVKPLTDACRLFVVTGVPPDDNSGGGSDNSGGGSGGK
ncbi:MAG: protein phosphatase 2C domain-containing protein [Caldilinea sp.]|nr:protein phosphatase 2C domain-containing protein [Caldilineaceae bacterium]MCO5208539.1 protein phosphatase 2C domain-containing protein [Caldilinea sp.]